MELENTQVVSPLQDVTCERCELFLSCESVNIPGEGPLDSEVMVLGISPGGWEDKYKTKGDADGWPEGVHFPLGRPFVGESGKLLRAVLLSNLLAEYDDVFPEHPKPLVRLTNVVRCRPPENRDPTASEQRACATYLESEIKCMPRLRYVVALGSLPMKALGVVGSVTDLAGVPRKTTLWDRELVVIPVFHPAAVLRRQTYLSTWESHWHQIRNIIRPSDVSFAEKVGARIYLDGLEGKDWRTL